MKGMWHNRESLEFACRTGFQGLLLTPITLTLTFLLDKLINL